MTTFSSAVADIPTAVWPAEQEELARLAEGGLVLELGTDRAASTIVMARTARHVHAVDWHRGDEQTGEQSTLSEAYANVSRYGLLDKVSFHVGRFEDVLPLFHASQFDLVFVDGAHSYDCVTRDGMAALRLVRAGGVIAFHDHGRFDVARAITDLHIGQGYLVDHLYVVTL